jgi:hypothetical protein
LSRLRDRLRKHGPFLSGDVDVARLTKAFAGTMSTSDVPGRRQGVPASVALDVLVTGQASPLCPEIGMRLLPLALLVSAAAAWAVEKPESRPQISSFYPLSSAPGVTTIATLRGRALNGPGKVLIEGTGVSAELVDAEPEAVSESSGKTNPVQLLRVRISVTEDAPTGSRELRLLTSRGLSDALTWHVEARRVVPEEDAAPALRQFPAALQGVVSAPGEEDTYWLEVSAGQTLTFEVLAGTRALDPVVSLCRAAPSWFDPNRIETIAVNDEPLYFPGLSKNARLVHTFTEAGRYCLRVSAFGGQGGPDSTYRLHVFSGRHGEPDLHPVDRPVWDERLFIRPVRPDRLAELSARAGLEDARAVEVFRAANGEGDLPSMSIPGIVEGRIQSPAAVDRIRLTIDQPQDLAFEFYTPEATMPRFNPVFRLLEEGGREVVTNVYTKLNNNGLYMMKMIQAKTTVSIGAPGTYTLEIRDITTDCAGEDFHYRLMVRPQIPHIGKVTVARSPINLEPGSTQAVAITVDREEGYMGLVSVTAEGLPTGVTAQAAMANPVEKPPLPNGGKLERYTALPQDAGLLFVAAPDALPTPLPVPVRIVVRPVVEGRLGPPVHTETVLLVVTERRPS